MDYSIGLTVVPDIEVKGKVVGDYIFDERTDTMYYQLPYLFPCKFAVVGLKKILVTPWMLRLPGFLKYHNIDWLRQQLMQVKCVENGAVLLHGAAWKKGGRGYLAVGFPNSGKTTTVLKEVALGATFCADENVIVTSDRTILPIFRHTSVNRYTYGLSGLPLTMWVNLRLLGAEIRAKLSPLVNLVYEPNIWVDLPYGRKSFKLDEIIYLTPGVQSLALLTDNEFPFYTNSVLQTYSYATGWDLDGVYANYRKVLKSVEGK